MRQVWLAFGLVACVTQAELERALDRDADGFRPLEVGGLDCDDEDPALSPNVPEACGDGLDNDCDGRVDDAGVGDVPWYADQDGDGYGRVGVVQYACPRRTDLVGWSLQPGDCDDGEAAIDPDATEVCDGVDNNCNGAVDEGC